MRTNKLQKQLKSEAEKALEILENEKMNYKNACFYVSIVEIESVFNWIFDSESKYFSCNDLEVMINVFSKDVHKNVFLSLAEDNFYSSYPVDLTDSENCLQFLLEKINECK